MTEINIVSDDRYFCRLIELELLRMGLSSQISNTPLPDLELLSHKVENDSRQDTQQTECQNRR